MYLQVATYTRELGLVLREYFSRREIIRACTNLPGAGSGKIHYDENGWSWIMARAVSYLISHCRYLEIVGPSLAA